MGRQIASESKQTVRGGPKPAKVGLHRRLLLKCKRIIFNSRSKLVFSITLIQTAL